MIIKSGFQSFLKVSMLKLCMHCCIAVCVVCSACCNSSTNSRCPQLRNLLQCAVASSHVGSHILLIIVLCYLINPVSFLLQNNIKNGIYPAPLQSLWATVAVLVAVHFAKVGMVHTCISAILVLMPGCVFVHSAHLGILVTLLPNTVL
jgi:hypothetical protein